MDDPYGLECCPACGQPWFSTETKKRCPGPSIEEMHAALAANLKEMVFLTEIPSRFST